MKERRLNEIKGVTLVAAGLIVLASLVSFDVFDLGVYTSHPNIPPHNLIRGFGAYLAGTLLFLFGWASSIIPVFILYLGVRIFRQDTPDLRLPRVLGLLVLLLSASSLLGMFNFSNSFKQFSHGGFLGFVISSFITTYFGRLGGYIVFITLMILSFALVTEVLISTLLIKFSAKTKDLLHPVFKFKKNDNRLIIKSGIGEGASGKKKSKDSLVDKVKNKIAESLPKPKEAIPVKPKIQINQKSIEKEEFKVKPQELKIGDYHLPSLDLMDPVPPVEARLVKEDLAANAKVLEETLADFGISVKVTDIERGPVITRYELDPAPGVKVNGIVALGDDISLAMKAQSVRIIAPIPGKARVGIEVPNMQSTMVYLKEILASKEFVNSKSKLTLALGKDVAGYPVIADLVGMPHLLIAGTTGSGKTVCVNTLIISMLLRNSPQELKFLMVDPKMVELAPYNGMPHLMCPVVTDAKKAAIALNWVVSEMENRYQILSESGSRNIEIYNEKKPQEKMPYIVVVIDEMADLMMVARDQIEGQITRLAQLSRAVGIHLIMATQRPSVDVVTGVIKANFPARISFKVASKVDSRTVLDMNGADKLLGKGDMLFLKPGDEKLTRAQGALVKDGEIERIVEFIKAQGKPVYNEEILKDQQKSGVGGGDKDDLYEEAVKVVMESNQASVSILQRRMRLGYTRAARIIDMMEGDGLVGPFEGSKPRRILVDRDQWLQDSVMPKGE